MKDKPDFMGDDESLSRRLAQSAPTILGRRTQHSGVRERLQRFQKACGKLGMQPAAAALLHEQTDGGGMSCTSLGARLVVGRSRRGDRHSDGSDLAFTRDSGMSRRHFVITAEGRLHRLKDLGSRNHTLLNGEAVPEGGAVMKAGDMIRAGETEFFYTGPSDSP